MIPYRDENPTRTFPLVTVLLIAANVAVFLYQVTLPPREQVAFIYSYALVPAFLVGKAHALVGDGLRLEPFQPVWLTVFTSMFMHGGFLHIAGNMLYLWIFGNNIEEALGRARFLFFYLFCGAMAAVSQLLFSYGAKVPMLGASGAVAGVLGAYFVLFPAARIRTLVFIFFFITVVSLPASLVLTIWFLYQILGSLNPQSGIATFAHIGGFVTGYLWMRTSGRRPKRRYAW